VWAFPKQAPGAALSSVEASRRELRGPEQPDRSGDVRCSGTPEVIASIQIAANHPLRKSARSISSAMPKNHGERKIPSVTDIDDRRKQDSAR
jgi:hypothetical protein